MDSTIDIIHDYLRLHTHTPAHTQNPLPSSALVAVALQDHISRQLSLSNHLPEIKKPSNIHGCRRCGKTTVSNVQTNRQMHKRPTGTDTMKYNHSARTSLPHNLTGGNNCARSRTKDVSSTKGPPPASRGVGRAGEEYVLDTTPPPLTLAQRWVDCHWFQLLLTSRNERLTPYD